MFDALLKPKFYTKCKSCLKLTKMRLDTIQKKRNAVQKFLKKDIVDLLSSALDYNAYGRAEGLLVEQNMSFCYELVAKFASCILGHVRDLCKQGDLTAECKEAIQSLIYAAARFSDLPELRELRTLFTGKFGNSLEPFLSKEFVNKLRQDPPSKEMKIQLLRDLAQEFSIKWNSKALEKRLNFPPQLHEDKAKYDHNDHKNNDVKASKINNLVVGEKGRHSTTSTENENHTLFQGRKDISDSYRRLQSSTDNETTTENSSLDGYKVCSSSLGSASEDEVEMKRPFSYKLVPPPYVKEKLSKDKSNVKITTESQAPPPEKESKHDIRESIVPKKPIPRSVRRRPLKSPSHDNNSISYSKKTNGNDTVKVDSDEKKSEKANQHQQTKSDDEERKMDRLLMHYIKKQYPREAAQDKLIQK